MINEKVRGGGKISKFYTYKGMARSETLMYNFVAMSLSLYVTWHFFLDTSTI